MASRAGSSAKHAGNILDSMPAELMLEVLGNLRPHDLTKLARVSKKYRELAQAKLWRNIELHRRDVHDGPWGVPDRENVHRAHLDDKLRNPWTYLVFQPVRGETDLVFQHYNASYNAIIKKYYQTAGMSQGWKRIAGFVRSLCLTVNGSSPTRIWNIILSLKHLDRLEVIGENNFSRGCPPAATGLREPLATEVHVVRLRGYIPAAFISTLCKASASTITSLDLGVIEQPRSATGVAVGGDQRVDGSCSAPRGVLWFKADAPPMLPKMSHLLLCKPGNVGKPEESYEEEMMECTTDREHEALELQSWASLLRTVSTHLAELVLELRPVCSCFLLDGKSGIVTDSETEFGPDSPSDELFFRHVLKEVFGVGRSWSKLRKLTLRGINFRHFEQEMGESLQNFASRLLPG